MKRQNTKQLLANCLKELMATQPVDKITIQDITTKLNVNRQTFYYHFTDIYDLLKWTLQQEAVQLLQDKESDLLWNEGILALFYYLNDNRAFALCAVQSLGIDQFKHFFYGEVYEIIARVIEQFGKELIVDQAYVDFLTHFYTLSLPTIAISWLQGEIEHTPEEIVEMMDITFRHQLYGAQHYLKEK